MILYEEKNWFVQGTDRESLVIFYIKALNQREGKMIFEGSAAAVVTPMAENGAIDFEAMGKLLEFQLENGTDAIVVTGLPANPPRFGMKRNISLLNLP